MRENWNEIVTRAISGKKNIKLKFCDGIGSISQIAHSFRINAEKKIFGINTAESFLQLFFLFVQKKKRQLHAPHMTLPKQYKYYSSILFVFIFVISFFSITHLNIFKWNAYLLFEHQMKYTNKNNIKSKIARAEWMNAIKNGLRKNKIICWKRMTSMCVRITPQK